MFSYIKGKVADIMPDRAVIEAAGVGFELMCPASTLKLLTAGEMDKLYVHMQTVFSQDSLTLYGFYTAEERSMFRKLLSVSRVGPKLALSVLSSLTPRDIVNAVLTDNAAAFDLVSGMGRKTAARVILDLKEKIGADNAAFDTSSQAPAQRLDVRSEAVAALVALGYDGVTAGRAVANVEDSDKVEDMITRALREIAGRSKK